MNRAGIELAASLIVILIVSVLMLGLAGGITYRLFCASGDKINEIDDATQRQLERKLDSGAAVQIPDSSKTAKSSAGFCSRSSGDSAVFTLGVRNDNLADADFSVECTQAKIQTPSGLEDSELCDHVQGESTFLVGVAQKESKLLVVNVPAGIPPGKHVLTMTVFDLTNGNSFYGAANIYLTVE